MACASVPKIVLTVNHASGAGYYAMAGQGFDPDFIFSLPTGRMGVMEGDSAVMAVHGPELEKLKNAGQPVPPDLQERIDKTRADYETWLDSRHAASRGHCDAILDPLHIPPAEAEDSRGALPEDQEAALLRGNVTELDALRIDDLKPDERSTPSTRQRHDLPCACAEAPGPPSDAERAT